MLLKAVPMLFGATAIGGMQPAMARLATGTDDSSSSILYNGRSDITTRITVNSPQLQTRTSSFVAKYSPVLRDGKWDKSDIELGFPISIKRAIKYGNSCHSATRNYEDTYYSYNDLLADPRISIDLIKSEMYWVGIRFTDNFAVSGGEYCYYPGTGGGNAGDPGGGGGGCDPMNPMCRVGYENYYDPPIPPRWEYESYSTESVTVITKFGVESINNNVRLTFSRTDWNAAPAKYGKMEKDIIENLLRLLGSVADTYIGSFGAFERFAVLLLNNSDYFRPADYYIGKPAERHLLWND